MSDKNFKVKNGIDANGTVTASAFSGDGSLLTNLPASAGPTGPTGPAGTAASSDVIVQSSIYR